MEAVAHIAGSVRRPSPRVRQVLFLAAVVLAGMAVLAVHQTTVPSDPLPGSMGGTDVYDMPAGTTATFSYPIVTNSKERAVIESASLVPSAQTEVISLHGLTGGVGFAEAGSPAKAALRQHAHLVPLAGMQFATAPAASSTRSWLRTHVFVAVTVKVLGGSACAFLPPLDLRYRVGDTQFHRIVPAPVAVAMPGTPPSMCDPATPRS